MKKGNAAKNLRAYISEHQISIPDIVSNTGVAKNKLQQTSKEDLNATEFLEICYFLKVDPRSFISDESAIS
ncbi:MAG: hypothetical protein IJ711_10940 [Lachnospiraceae bacterium]|nr:hypothetical protein [Lachnospiraceae bacterium]